MTITAIAWFSAGIFFWLTIWKLAKRKCSKD